jgi:hypothetical protein
MSMSPFAFLRGSADVMARDLARTPTTGLRVQACGDAHVGNFGEFATPEHNIVFDVNDFDETLPGPFEWDLKRLAASLEVVLRVRDVPPAHRRRIVATAMGIYRTRMAEYASLRMLEIWYAKIDIGEVLEFFPPQYRHLVELDLAKAKRRTHLRAMSKLTSVSGGHRRFIEDPPLLVRLEDTGHDMEEVVGLIDGYRSSLSEDVCHLFDRFRLVDVARKVVGVGSVGTRSWLGLLEGPHHPAGDPLFLQVKEATSSVLEPFAGASGSGPSRATSRCRAAPDTGGERHLPRLVDWATIWSPLLRPPAPGREGSRRPEHYGHREPRPLRQSVRLGAREGTRANGRSRRHQRLLGQERPHGSCTRHLRRPIWCADLAGPRRTGHRRRGWSDRGPSRGLRGGGAAATFSRPWSDVQ